MLSGTRQTTGMYGESGGKPWGVVRPMVSCKEHTPPQSIPVPGLLKTLLAKQNAAVFAGNLSSGPVCDLWFNSSPFKEKLPSAPPMVGVSLAPRLGEARAGWTRADP